MATGFKISGLRLCAGLAALGMLSAVACAGKSAGEIPANVAAGPDGEAPPADNEPASPVAQSTGVGGGTQSPDPAQSSPSLPACAGEALDMPGYTNLALYHFEETQGAQLFDSSDLPAGSDSFRQQGGTLLEGRRTEGHCGRGLTFDSDGAHLEFGAMGGSSFDNGIAVSVWLRPASISPGEAHIVGDGAGGISSFQLVLDSGYPVFRLSNPLGEWDELLRASAPLVPGAWQHLTLTYEPGAGKLAVDGQALATTDTFHPIEGSYNIVAAGAITNLNPCCSYYHQYLGDLDELAVFGR